LPSSREIAADIFFILKAKGNTLVKELCVHMYVNAKMIAVETTPGIRGEWDGENG
jgi:hypothetical protein